MKNTFIFLLLIVFITACSSSKDEQIIGFWKLEKVNTNQQITNKNEYKSAMVQLIRTTSIQFNKDFTFGATIWNDTSYGSWQIIGDTLFISDESNKTNFGVRINELSHRKLVLQEAQDSVIEMLTFSK